MYRALQAKIFERKINVFCENFEAYILYDTYYSIWKEVGYIIKGLEMWLPWSLANSTYFPGIAFFQFINELKNLIRSNHNIASSLKFQ